VNDSFALSVLFYAMAIAAVCAARAATGTRRSPALVASLVVLEVVTIIQALADGLALLRGDHGPNVLTNLGYLIVSLLVLPVTIASVRADPGRWGSAATALGAVVLAVVSLRLHATLHGSYA
jgi:hypothetical protein